MPPRSTLNHYRRLQRLKFLTLGGVRRSWRQLRPGGDWERQYEQQVGPQAVALVVAAQVAATNESDAYVADVLNELDFGPATKPGVVLPKSLAGYTGDGRQVETLLASAVGRTRALVSQASEFDQALSRATIELDALQNTQAWLDMVTESILADTARAAEEVATVQREWVDGYVRVVNPPCCSRCAVLAGKFYLWNDGFDRHPRCDCSHQPAPASKADRDRLFQVNTPDRYFDSLTEAEQNRVFTNAGAEAIRNGADISKVVNARRGMQRGQVYGRDVLFTTEGTTARGNAGRGFGQLRKVSGQKYRRSAVVRLMPESIIEAANGDRQEAIRLLTYHGYIT